MLDRRLTLTIVFACLFLGASACCHCETCCDLDDCCSPFLWFRHSCCGTPVVEVYSSPPAVVASPIPEKLPPPARSIEPLPMPRELATELVPELAVPDVKTPQPLPQPPELKTPPAPSEEIKKTPAALRLELFDVRDPVPVGEVTEYIIRITNQGGSPATGLKVRAVCSEELKTEGVVNVSFEEVGRSVDLPSFDLSAGGVKTFRLRVTALGAGDARVKISLSGSDLESPVNEEESTTVH